MAQVLSWIEEQDGAMASTGIDIAPGPGLEQPVEGSKEPSKRVRLNQDNADAPRSLLGGAPALATGLAAERRPPVGPPVKGVTK